MGEVMAPGIGSNEGQFHRSVVQLGLVLSLAATVATVIVGLVAGRSLVYVALPAAMTASFGSQAWSRRPDARLAVAAATVALILLGRWTMGDYALIAGVLGLLTLVFAGLLVAGELEWRNCLVGLVAVEVAVWWWSPLIDLNITSVALVVGVAFLFGFGLMAALVNASRRSGHRYATLYTAAPIGLIEEDWTDALALLRSRTGGAEDLRSRLLADPGLLEEVVARVRVVGANEAAARIERVDPADMLGSLRDRIHGLLDPELWSEEVAAIAEGQGVYRGRSALQRHDGTLAWIELGVTVIEPPARVIVTITDVTEGEEARLRLEQEALSKDRFIAAISHELRTPLAAIVGFSQLLTSGREVTVDEKDEMMQFIADEANQVAWVVEDLLVTARTDSGLLTIKSAPVDLTTEVRLAMKDVPGIPLEGDVSGWGVMADAGRLRHIVRNILVNAVEHGGVDRRAVVAKVGDDIVLEVRDSGPPMSGEDLERIFSPYETAHERPGLTASVGLGLAVARRLAQLMGGDLTYEHDGETVFRLALPAVPLGLTGVASNPLQEWVSGEDAEPRLKTPKAVMDDR
jgi:signal transduction histidine kinase